MKILVFSWRDPKHPTAGGAEQVMHEHMKGWLQAGHKLRLFSSRVEGLPGEEALDGIEIVRKGDQYFGVKIAAFFYYLKNKQHFDFVVDQFHGVPFFTPFYIKKPKLAVLQEVAGRVWFLNEFPFPLNYLVGFLGYLFEPIIFQFYKKIPFMVGSNSAKADLAKMGIPAKNITVVPHGIILPKSNIRYPKSDIRTITYLGALAKDKGIEDTLQTFAILDNQANLSGGKSAFQFWVIGRGSPQYKKYLFSLCRKLGITKKVKFWGFVNQERKFELLAKSHVLINPSVHEGWGLVNIEANSMGTPVIAYRSAGLVNSVKDGISGIIVARNTPYELAQNAQKVLGERKIYGKLQKGAIAWSKKFSWAESRKRSLELVNRVAIRG